MMSVGDIDFSDRSKGSFYGLNILCLMDDPYPVTDSILCHKVI